MPPHSCSSLSVTSRPAFALHSPQPRCTSKPAVQRSRAKQQPLTSLHLRAQSSYTTPRCLTMQGYLKDTGSPATLTTLLHQFSPHLPNRSPSPPPSTLKRHPHSYQLYLYHGFPRTTAQCMMSVGTHPASPPLLEPAMHPRPRSIQVMPIFCSGERP